MRKILTLLLLFNFNCSINYAQTVKLNINAASVTFSKLYGKAFVAVYDADENYANSLLQLNPFNGVVEKHMPLSDVPKSVELTPDNKHLYLSYQSLSKIEKINIADFKIVETITLGDFKVMDFAILPVNDNVLIACNGSSVVMYKDGILQPKHIVCSGLDYMSEICIKNDGLKLYAHNGLTTGCEGHIMNIVEDGIEYDGIIWNYMMPYYGLIKSHNDLIFNEFGDVIDAFSDSIPIIKASMPVYKITRWRTGFEYSDIHRCYVFGHENQHEAFISFFDGQYFNYLGSIGLGIQCEIIYDIDVVDANHFVLIALGFGEYKNSILLCASTKSKGMIRLKPTIDNSRPSTGKYYHK